MAELYSSKEGVEHIERAHEVLEHGGDVLLRFVALLAALLAILAGLSSLYASRLVEKSLSLRNEAVLHGVTASDLWSEYQAESVKAHLYEINALTQSGKLAGAMRAKAAKYRTQQAPLMKEARRNESERDAALQASEVTERRKAGFDVALALFEVCIVLTSIAAIIRRPFLLVLAALGGAAGLVLGVRGMFGGMP